MKILFPIQEENHFEVSVDKESYKDIFKQCHLDIKEMKFGVKNQKLKALPKLKELILDIEALKTGNYIVVDYWLIYFENQFANNNTFLI